MCYLPDRFVSGIEKESACDFNFLGVLGGF